MRELGHEIVPIDTQPREVRNRQKHLFPRVIRKVLGPQDLAKANQRISRLIKETSPDVLWLDKALTINPATLRIVQQVRPKTIIAGYSPDDMAAKHNQSEYFLQSLPFYDIYFTTKTYNVAELKGLGAREVVFIAKAYDPHTHRPIAVSEKERAQFGGPVGFIGAFEGDRAQHILALAEAGINVRVWGGWDNKGWSPWVGKHSMLEIEKQAVWGDDYSRTICSFDINLCFLRKINRDLQTARSIEIPACGAFMLAERTSEHLELFEEGKEAEFFSSDEELLEKAKYYLAHPEERRCIAAAGRERCLKSGYSYHERLKGMLKIVAEIRRGKN